MFNLDKWEKAVREDAVLWHNGDLMISRQDAVTQEFLKLGLSPDAVDDIMDKIHRLEYQAPGLLRSYLAANHYFAQAERALVTACQA